ncbi:RNA polymerase sigma factor [Sediminicola luteus]|uniref:RNA polymerase sigma factor n=1 Tax=Sediminicola luteus TaxID=319238 RepID=A0A2A4GAB5_9FLAO|nr:RNA polymerase sigma factor [Sediminicola luteus]PCE64926.1 RNA polymerase subunit sigma-70 [Sediminicola luteus]
MLQTDLIKKCRQNDRTAQMALYRKYCDGMFHVALRYVRHDADAEDILQEAFIRAFSKLDQYKGEVSFGAWLKRIVINKCIDFIKAKKELTVGLDEGFVHLADDNDWEMETDVSMAEVHASMEALPEKYRQVVLLYLVEGYDHQEISQILGISETACRTRLLRGKGKLKERLKEIVYGTGS